MAIALHDGEELGEGAFIVLRHGTTRGKLFACFKIVFVGGYARLQFLDTRAISCVLSQVNTRFEFLDVLARGDIDRQGIDDLHGLIVVARLAYDFGQIDQNVCIIWFDGVGLLEQIDCLFDGAGIGLLARLIPEGPHFGNDVFFQEFSNLAFRQSPHELIHRRAIDEQHHGRQAADAELTGQLRFDIRVDLGELQFAAIAFSDLFEHGFERPARAAPLRPEIHKYRRLKRRVDDAALKFCGGNVENIRQIGHEYPRGLNVKNERSGKCMAALPTLFKADARRNANLTAMLHPLFAFRRGHTLGQIMSSIPESPAVRASRSARHHPYFWPLVALLLPGLLWGYNWVVMKGGLSEIAALWFGALRTIIPAGLLLLLLPATGRSLRPPPMHYVIPLGLLQTAGFVGFMMWALQTGAAGETAVIVFTMPLWLMLMAHVVLHERLTLRQWLALGIAGIGLFFMIAPWRGHLAVGASLFAVLSGLTWAGGSIWQMLFGGFAILLAALLLEPWRAETD